MSKFNISFFFGILLLLVAGLVSCDKKTDSYTVHGKLDNLTGEYFYMSHELGDSLVIDTVRINDKGEFSFSGNVDTLTVMSLHFNHNTKGTFILVNKNWDVELKGDAVYADLIEVKGGDVNNDLTEFKNKNKDLIKSRTDILNAAEEKINSTDSLSISDYMGDLKNANFELSNIAAAYIKDHPDKIASVMLINVFFKDESFIPRLDEVLILLKGRAADFPLTAELKKFRDKVKMSAQGAYAPSFTLKDLKGKEIKLSDFRGKHVLLNFAATTCDICKEEKADAVAVYNKLKKEKKNFEFVTIVKDIEQIPVSKNITDSVKWFIIPVSGGWSAPIFDTYYVREIPYNILISPSGYINERNVDIHTLSEKVR